MYPKFLEDMDPDLKKGCKFDSQIAVINITEGRLHIFDNSSKLKSRLEFYYRY